ncbi:hypothetical protein CDL12_11829 [Handroanthus impetiginosus]|uniref:Uncharacterized protein n=1 Tax=Handroanthus impetiginosus TaxID=429701 RepID=A0A2G9HDC6_9LAMI|nr:hypothetical protein CDL12_11829 [Handroanthus impetiginosus]
MYSPVQYESSNFDNWCHLLASDITSLLCGSFLRLTIRGSIKQALHRKVVVHTEATVENDPHSQATCKCHRKKASQLGITISAIMQPHRMWRAKSIRSFNAFNAEKGRHLQRKAAHHHSKYQRTKASPQLSVFISQFQYGLKE